jgi:subtilisin family serine protease
MKRLYLWVVAACAIGVLLVLTMGAQKSDKPDQVNGKEVEANEVLIKFHGASWADIENAKLKGDILHAKKIGGIGAYRFHSSSKKVEELMSLYAEEPTVEYVEPNYVLYVDEVTPNDPRFPDLWGMKVIQAPAAWAWSTGSKLVTVGVVDTGIDYTHPDLAGNVWTAAGAFNVTIGDEVMTCPAGSHGYNAIRGTFDPMDDNDHGTHVSGTIGAVGNNGIGVAGVNWTASIMGMKFLNNQGSGSTADAIDAIEFAIQAKLKGAANVRVLSNSWGGGSSTQSMRAEIHRAYENQILFVCSAGNSGAGPVRNYYLPTYNELNLLAVAASNGDDYLAGFSNYGYWSIHLAAPGVNVLSTVRKKTYASYNGTSMAAPHVSGTAALVASWWKSQGSDVTVDQLRSILINSVDVVDKELPGGYADPDAKNIFGNVISNGRLNASQAISTPLSAVAPFPDYVMTFEPTMKSVLRGATADYTLKIEPFFGYSESNLKIGLSCCSWYSVTVTMEYPAGNWINLSETPQKYIYVSVSDLMGPVYLPMRVATTSKTSVMDYRITIFAEDVKDPGELGPFLYHNDTAYLSVVRR